MSETTPLSHDDDFLSNPTSDGEEIDELEVLAQDLAQLPEPNIADLQHMEYKPLPPPQPLGDELKYAFGSTPDIEVIYRHDNGYHELLTSDEEIELAKKVERGKTAQAEIMALHRSKMPVSFTIMNAAREGEKAKDSFVRHNIGLVIDTAKRYYNRTIPFIDLLQEGNIGLLTGIDRYDYRRGFRFSTYAAWWVRQAIERANAQQGRIIRIPVHQNEYLGRFIKVKGRLIQESFSEPTTREVIMEMRGKALRKKLQKKLGYEPSDEEVQTALDPWVEKMDQILNVASPTSLEKPVGNEEDGGTFGDFVQDSTMVTEDRPDEYLIRVMATVLESLSSVDREILEARYGFLGDEESLAEIGQKDSVNLRRQGVQQRQDRVFRRLRNNPELRRLAQDYFNK